MRTQHHVSFLTVISAAFHPLLLGVKIVSTAKISTMTGLGVQLLGKREMNARDASAMITLTSVTLTTEFSR